MGDGRHLGVIRPSVVHRLFGAYLFDLDGTVWLTDEVVPGAQRQPTKRHALLPDARAVIRALRSRGCQVAFMTNNADGTRESFAQELSDLGVRCRPDDVLCTAFVMARYLSSQQGGKRCYVIGPDPLREELCRAGLTLRDRPGEIDFVVLGIDRDFTYHKLQTAFEAIRAGARLVATNSDPWVPATHGDLADIGALIAAIEVASEHRLDKLVGKPDPLIVEVALERLGEESADCVIVGDQLDTDVLAGQRAGVPTALLLRDPRVVARLRDWQPQPDFLLDNLRDLVV
jgi:HAD superfamily hydrolase (TIGR01450 family)